jgi:beta-lactamase class A
MTIRASLTRRAVVAGIGSGMASAWTSLRASATPQAQSKLAALETQLTGRVGVLAVDTSNGARLAHRADERFAMCSTFKLILSAAILAKADRGQIKLTQALPYSSADLLDHAPVTTAHLDEGKLSVETLAKAVIEVSDNTAANLLLSLVGGPSRLTSYLRELGDPVTRLDRTEPSLNTNRPGDERDTTTPSAMIGTMQRILIGDALSVGAKDKLIGWMNNSRTGLERLRAGLPSDWIVGDKTGTGVNGAVNDLAIVWPPKRAPILIAVYMSESTRAVTELNAAHAEIGRIIVETFS